MSVARRSNSLVLVGCRMFCRLIVLVVASLPYTVGLAASVLPDDAAARVPLAVDLQIDGRAASAGDQVILLIISSSDCPYCRKLKRAVIGPMIVSGAYDQKVIIRELIIDSPDQIRDFDGQLVSAAHIAGRYDERLTPTVLLLDGSGTERAARRRGIASAEYYGYYLDKAIDSALEQIRQSKPVNY